MAALICDVCGGKLIMETGGNAICDSCGAEHSRNRVQEKAQEIKDVVQVDNAHMIDKWMKMGAEAASNRKHKEAYRYFAKVVESDPENWRAIYETGKAGAWQSTTKKIRTSELNQGIQRALEIIKRENMSAEELRDIKNEFAVALYKINTDITDSMGDKLYEIEDKYAKPHWNMMWDTWRRYIANIEEMENALRLISDLDDDLSKENALEIKKRICDDIQSACESTQYWLDRKCYALGYLGFRASEKKKYLDKYWNLVDEIREVEPDYRTRKGSYPDPFDPEFHSVDEIYEYWKKADDERRARREKERLERRNREYWEAHSEEKRIFEQRLSAIKEEKEQIQSALTGFSDKTQMAQKEQEDQFANVGRELDALKAQISSLEATKGELGFFAIKQKKEIRAQIASLKATLPDVEEKVNCAKASIKEDIDSRLAQINAERKPFSDRFDALTAEENDINVELTKQR